MPRNTPLVLGGLLLLGAGAVALLNDDDQIDSTSRVLLLGDSHLGSPAFRKTITDALAARGAQVVGTLQNNGWSEKRYLDSGKLSRLPGRPNSAVVVLGGNNRIMDPSRYQAVLQQLVQTLRGQGVGPILWAGPATSNAAIAPSTAARHEATANMQRDMLPGLDVTWWDSRPATMDGQRGDGVHFTSSGYRRWAAGIMRA